VFHVSPGSVETLDTSVCRPKLKLKKLCLLGHMACAECKMQPIVTDVPWSVYVCACLCVGSDRDLC